MEYKATIEDVRADTSGILITYRTKNRTLTEKLQAQQGKELSVKASPVKGKRSLNANAYYWQLVGQMARLLNVSNNYMHNQQLRKYGYIEIISSKPIYLVIRDDIETEQGIEESETYHLKPTSEVKIGNDGKPYRTYMMLRGSSSYNVEEFSRLINGTVGDAQDLGIETATVSEIDRMLERWGKEYAKHHPKG